MRVTDHDFTLDFEDILDSAESYAKNDWEEQFVSDLRDKYDEWGDEMFLSDRQADILLRIAKVEE